LCLKRFLILGALQRKKRIVLRDWFVLRGSLRKPRKQLMRVCDFVPLTLLTAPEIFLAAGNSNAQALAESAR
jgi:hypothetical protein